MSDQGLIKYEIGFLAKGEEDKREVVKILEKHNARILKDGMPTRVKLSYPIKKEDSAYFSRIYFESDTQGVKGIAADLALSNQILRFLTSRFDEKKAESERSRSSIWQLNRGTRSRVEPSAGGIKEADDKKEKAADVEEKIDDLRGRKEVPPRELTNEALEKKLEEMLSE